MSHELPHISVIIVCRNEERYIVECVTSLFENNPSYPRDHIECIIADGMSTDATREKVHELQKKYAHLRLVDNPGHYSPHGRNAGIKAAKHSFLFLLDAHAQYPHDYLYSCITGMNSVHADCVGVRVEAHAAHMGLVAQSIAGCLAYGSGSGGGFRVETASPLAVDSIFSGCYKKSVFDDVGLYNENLIRSQDMDLSIRMKKKGKKLILLPGAPIRYFARHTYSGFLKQNFSDGIWSTFPLKYGVKLKLRHYLPLLFVIGLFGGGVAAHYLPLLRIPYYLVLALYLLIVLYGGQQNAKRHKRFLLMPLTAFMLITRHVIYGLGGIVGLFKILF